MVTITPKISIITATFNCVHYLPRISCSIQAQKNQDIEWVIVDGGSNDGTRRFLESHQTCADKWISEKDQGIYDAWNKGVALASGEWIMFLGADDLLAPNSIGTLLSAISKAKDSTEIISSKLEYIDNTGNHIKYVGEPWNWQKFKWSRLSFAHPGMLHRRSLFQRVGLYDLSFKICGDSELLMRSQIKNTAEYIDDCTVIMQAGGASDSYKATLESFHSRAKNHILPLPLNLLRLVILVSLYTFSKFKLKHKINQRALRNEKSYLRRRTRCMLWL